jgi:chemotaxis family two-component system response regulator Rcp1
MGTKRVIRLLVVEDNAGYLYLIKKAFQDRQGETRWDLTVARDGEEAIRALFDEQDENVPFPDLILLDWNLPRISGNEVLRRVKQHEKLRRLPVLVFSTSKAEVDIHSAYDDHANGYITKPGTTDELMAIVETIERFWIAVANLPKLSRKADPH